MKRYSYIFVRQDISVEQQIIQAAHATMQIGYKIAQVKPFDRMNHPTGTVAYVKGFGQPTDVYFVLIGVRNLGGLYAVEKILAKFGYMYETFFEPDIQEKTAICTMPVDEYSRDVLQAFNTLRVNHSS